MKKYYKLTTQDCKTRVGCYNETQWKLGRLVRAFGNSTELCTDGWIHCYTSPLIAIIRNPADADIKNPRLWLFEPEFGTSIKEERLKVGVRAGKITKELPVPKITNIQKVAFSILCAKCVCKNEEWNIWADRWLDNIDRSSCAAAADAVYAAAYAVADAAAYAAAADAANAAYAVADAATAAYTAAAAASAATAAATADAIIVLDFDAIAKEAMKY